MNDDVESTYISNGNMSLHYGNDYFSYRSLPTYEELENKIERLEKRLKHLEELVPWYAEDTEE